MVALLTMPNRLKPNRIPPHRLQPTAVGPVAAGSERRMFGRAENHTRVEGRRVDHSLMARRSPHLSLALRDLSMGGCSAITDMPLEAGERLAVFFPPQGASRGWDAFGASFGAK